MAAAHDPVTIHFTVTVHIDGDGQVRTSSELASEEEYSLVEKLPTAGLQQASQAFMLEAIQKECLYSAALLKHEMIDAKVSMSKDEAIEKVIDSCQQVFGIYTEKMISVVVRGVLEDIPDFPL